MSYKDDPIVKKALQNLEKPRTWPDTGDLYYFITGTTFRVSSDAWLGTSFDRNLLKANNCFQDRDRAEKAATRMKDFIKKVNPL